MLKCGWANVFNYFDELSKEDFKNIKEITMKYYNLIYNG